MNIDPVSDVCICKEIERAGKTSAGLYIPDSVEKDSVIKAEVLVAGPGEMSKTGILIPNNFEKGDIIVFERRRALPVTYEGSKYLFINANQVFGTVNNEKETVQ